MTLLETYINYNRDFIESLNSFSEISRNRLLKKLKKETNKTNFKSILSEIKFGKLFNTLDIECEYDRKFSNSQTPDWVLSLNSSKLICDVYRLGQSKIDNIRSDFEYQLIKSLEKIAINYALKISFVEEYFNEDLYDLNDIVSSVEKWLLSKKRELSEKITINDNFVFEILSSKTKYKHLIIAGNTSSIDYKPGKLVQLAHENPNEITKKSTKYNHLIQQYNLSYFICIDIDFVSGFDHDDFEDYFLGNRTEFIDYGTELGNLEQFKHLGKEWTTLGKFYENQQLSGIITCYNQSFKLLLNPLKQQIIHQNSNTTILKKLKEI